MHVSLYVKWPLKLSNLLPPFFVKFSNDEFHGKLTVPETLNAYRWTARVIFIHALEGCQHTCTGC